jgi:PST family polysaccharide transporter
MDIAVDDLAAPGALPPDEAGNDAPAVDMGTAAALGVLGSGVSLVLSIVRSKVTALVLGPAGLGKVAEVMQIVTIANLPATMMTGPALVSGVAEAARRGDRAEVERIARTATTVAIGASILGGTIAVVAGFGVLPAPWGRSAWPYTVLAAAAALFTAWAAISQQILTAHARLKQLTVVRLLMTSSGVALLCAGMLLLGLTGQFLGMAVAAAIGVPIAGVALRRELGFFVWPARDLDLAFVRRALTIGATAFVAGLAQQSVLSTVRATLHEHGGDAANGQFQAAYAIGATYFGIVLDGIGTYVLPRYAAAQSSAELAGEIDAAARFVFRMAPPAIFAAIAMRGLLVRALYSGGFEAAIDLVGLQMVGDMARSIAWVQASPLLYRNRIRAFVITEAFAAVMVAGGTLVLVPRFGINGVGYAYLIMWVGYVILTAVVVAKSCDVPFAGRRLVTTLALTAAAYLVLRVTNTYPAARGVVLAGVVVAWYRNGVLGGVWRKVSGKLSTLFGALHLKNRKKSASPPP